VHPPHVAGPVEAPDTGPVRTSGVARVGLTRLCAVDEVPDGTMTSFFLDGWEVLVLRDHNGAIHAFDAICPHEDFPLVDGIFDGSTITCIGHRWMFDATSGKGVNPPNCRLSEYPITIEGDEIMVDLDGEVSVSLP
jgi:toluene monooxygenase system ferredoxin subunit